MKKCGKVKNPCKLCFDTVSNKNGLRCQGACKKWVHFKCLNYTPGKIQDIKAGLIKINCPCPDCDTGNKEEVLHDSGYICNKPKCPARSIPSSCDVPLCPKKFPIPRGIEIQCPEDCPPYPDAPELPCCMPPMCPSPPVPTFLPRHPPPFHSPPCHPPPCHPPFPPSCPSETTKKGTQFSQPCKKSQTHVQKPATSQTNCPLPNCVTAKDTSPRSPRRTPRGTPRGTPMGTPKKSPSPRGNHSPRRTPSPRGNHSPRRTPSPRGIPSPRRVPSPIECPSPNRCPSPRGTPPRATLSGQCAPPRCPAKPGLAPKFSPPKSCLPTCASPKPPCPLPKPQSLPPRPQCLPPKPKCPPTRPPCPPGRPQNSPPRSCSPPRCFYKKPNDECSRSMCKQSVLNDRKLSISRSYCSSYASAESMPRSKIRMGSKSDCNINTPEAARKLLLGAMEQMYNTVGNFSNQFRDLMCRMMEALEKC